MKKQRRIFMFVIAAALTTAFFSLPLLLSLGPVVQYGLTLLNRESPGTLQVQSCSIGWQQGLRCQGVIYEYPRQGLRLDAPELSSDKGVLVLLAAPQYLGAFTLDHPVVTLNSSKKERQQHRDFHDQQLTSVVTAGSGKPWWERTTLRLSVNHGRILVDSEDGSRQALATEVQLEGSLADGIINYAFDFLSGLDQEGNLQVQGHINLPPSGGALGETLISRSEMEIRGMDIAPFLAVAASRSNLPQGTGRLDATCSLRTAGLQNLAIQGTADLRNVRLFGGVLEPDQPQVDALQITFNGERDLQAGWRLNTLSLESEALRMEASGLYDYAVVLLTGEGTLDLPVIAAQIPYFLARHEKKRIKEGTIDFSLEMTGTVQGVPFPSRYRADSLTAVVDDLAVIGKEGPVYEKTQGSIEAEIRSPTKDGRVVVRDLMVADGWQEGIDAGQEVVWIDLHQRQLYVQQQRLLVRGERASTLVALRVSDWRQLLPFQDIVVEVRLHDTVAAPEADIEAMQEAIQAQLTVAIQRMFSAKEVDNEIEPGTRLENTQQIDQE